MQLFLFGYSEVLVNYCAPGSPIANVCFIGISLRNPAAIPKEFYFCENPRDFVPADYRDQSIKIDLLYIRSPSEPP
jgi:hypothetical protein